ncbi:MAG: hypothetical protein ABSA32_01080 [Candidatus Acidiferrales bacterium]|jgi:hypothetical protein
MKLLCQLAGLCVFALAAMPAVAQHGGGSSHGGGGGSHGGFSAGGHSSGGGSGHVSGGSSGSYGATGRVAESGGFHGSSGPSFTHPGTATHIEAGAREAGTGGGISGFTNSGGIRFSDFGFAASPRFTAQMIPSRVAAPPSRVSASIVEANHVSEADRLKWISHASDDHRSFRNGFHRYPHFGVWFLGAYGGPFCGPFVGDAFDQSFINYAGAFDCYSGGTFGMMLGPTADWLGSDVGDEDAGPYAAGDEPVADSTDDAAETDATTAAAPQVTMLQLKDGSIYGLTAYWVEGGELHYFTNYGGANVIPLDRIDLAKTVQLNAAHGQAFVLAAKRGASKSTH